MDTPKANGDIEIPWYIIKEFSKVSLPSASSPVHQQRLSYTTRNTPVQTDHKPSTALRFPSLPTTPDLVNCFNDSHDKKLAYNVLHAYVIGSSQPTTANISPRTSKNKQKQRKQHHSTSYDVKLTPVVQKMKDGERKLPRKIAPQNNPGIKRREKIPIDIPIMSPSGSMYNYKEMWSPIEEKKLVDMWKEGPTCIQHKQITARPCDKADKPVKSELPNNHIYKFSKVSSVQPVNHCSYRQKIATCAEPPKLSTSPYKYINTWLDAGGDVPKFLKST